MIGLSFIHISLFLLKTVLSNVRSNYCSTRIGLQSRYTTTAMVSSSAAAAAAALSTVSVETKNKINNITALLNHLYPNPPVPLNSCNSFTFLLSVVLSAQTTDGKVNEVTKELFRVAPTPEILANMEISDVQKIIQPVGLAPTKAKNIVNLSKLLVEKFNSQIPNNYVDLETLPGVGHKTASVVMSTVFGEPSIPVDTHIHRLALRWGLTKDEKKPDNVQKDLMLLFPQDTWNKLHLQLIYFGREYCSAKDHINTKCPMCSWVNKQDGKPLLTHEEHNGTFTPRKRAKGIVFYADRIEELVTSPELSPHKSPSQWSKHEKMTTHVTSGSNLMSALDDAATATATAVTVVTATTVRRGKKASAPAVPATAPTSTGKRKKASVNPSPAATAVPATAATSKRKRASK